MRVSILAALLVALVPAPVDACTCSRSPNPPCQATWQADAVFVGRVVAVGEPEPDQVLGRGFRVRRVRFAVSESFHGEVADDQTVVTGLGGGDCGYAFAAGERYVVYAWRREDGTLSTGICSRTTPESRAGEDLAYLRSLDDTPAPANGTVRGDVLVRFRDGRFLEPVAGAVVTLTGPKGRSTTRSAENGAFSFEVPAGTYSLAVEPPEGLKAMGSADVELPDTRACVAAWIVLTVSEKDQGRKAAVGLRSG